MHDTIELEGRGVPTAVIVTAPFVAEVDLQRTALGAERLEPVVIAHPLSTLTADEIAGRAAAAAPAVTRVLLGDAV